MLRTPESIKGDLITDQFKLYDLIWKRFVSSQMTPEVSEVTTVSLDAGDYLFRANGSRVLFKGFTAVDKTDKTERSSLPNLTAGDGVQVNEFFPEQHFTTPPPRYNDASLVKFLEESGIGQAVDLRADHQHAGQAILCHHGPASSWCRRSWASW